MSFGRTIIVEDDAAIQGSLVEICRDVLGLEPVTASTAIDAMARIESARPAVVLLDLTLPDHDGRWVAEQIRERGWQDQVRIVVLSAQTGVEDKAAALGAFAFLAKPFSLNDVLETLRKAEAG